ncbi:Uncharacterised protein [Escherichia coli]|nr:Uncharacterised protein [Shigella sonnei]CTU15012.1 Uncharacterised protein [Escherichia coli]GEF57342.1 hypothetical protein EC152489_03559 [Escherichia coli O145:H28]CSG26119.1 Uncharacterised protein [Shigella sonnei]CSG29224.1 Uncharacterised protein [Shigella sonnei]
MPFHNHPAQLLQVAIDIFNFICQLFDFGFEQIQQQLVGVTVYHRLATGTHTIQTKSGQFTLTQSKQTTITDGKCHSGVTGVIFRIFKEEEGVNMQAVVVFKETCRCFDVFQFRAGCQALAKFRLYAQSLVVVRFDKINPYCIYKGL